MADEQEVLSEAALELNESRLEASTTKDIYLLQWLATAEKAIKELPSDALAPALPAFNTTALRICTAAPAPSRPAPLPRPGRPIRHALARCIVALHARVESRTLFDLVQGLVKFVGEKENAGKNAEGAWNLWRVASWYLIGEIMRNMGANNMSFMAEIALTVSKVVKTTSTAVIVRTAGLSALAKTLSAAGKALPDNIAKDLLKLLAGKNGLADTAMPVQRCCAEVLVALSTYTTTIASLTEIDSVAGAAIRSLDKADYNTRRGLSKLIAHLLARTQSAGTAQPAPDRKGKKPAEDDGDAVTVVTSGADQSVKSMLGLGEMLKLMSGPFNRAGATRRTRNAMFDVYATVLELLGPTFVEGHYTEIVLHLMEEVVLPARSRSSRYEILAVRELVGVLLRQLIGTRLLSEQGQVAAVRELATSYLKKWPVLLPGQQECNPLVLVIALKEVGGLLLQLGSAAPSIQEALQEPLLQLLAHPSEAVRIHAAWCLRIYCYTTPLTLPKMIVKILADLDRDMSLIGTPNTPSDLAVRAIGRAYALAALIAAVPDRPLYVSYDISTTVMDTAIGLLKRAGDHDVRDAEIEVQVAWTMISALMTLGSSFVQVHLPQLLVLWRNALPKPTSKDASVGERGEREWWLFLLQVRECALSAILSFLRNNTSKEVVTLDVARRIAALLTNTLNFVNGFATAYAEALREQQQIQQQQQQGGSTGPLSTTFASAAGRATLADRENMLRRRILQCFAALGASSATESSQPALVMAAVSAIADPDNAAVQANATQAAIQASAGGFTDVWQSVDMYAFGVTALAPAKPPQDGSPEDLNRDQIEMAIETQMSSPLLGSLEHDFLDLIRRDLVHSAASSAGSVMAASGVIDAGITLFATLLPHQSIDTVMQAVTLMTNHLKSPRLERNPGRKQAVLYNALVALSRALPLASSISGRRARDVFGSTNVTGIIRALLQDGIVDSSRAMRVAASEAMGSLAALVGSPYLTNQAQWLVDQIVSNRIPDSRAGCAIALAAIYSHVGGFLAGPLLKTIVSVLMSLSSDPHPVVHYWAMSALARVVDSASLAYSPYVTTTLAMVAEIYGTETHEPEGGSVGSANIRGDLPAYQQMSRILHACIGVVGPELQEPSNLKELAVLLVDEFGAEPDEGLAVEAMRCFQQFLMFVPSDINIPALVATFRSHLTSRRRPLKVAAITALYQIVQRDAVLMSKLGGNQLVEDLFGLLDEDPSLDGVRQVIISWLQQTSAALPSGWIDLCQRIMNRSVAQAKPIASSSGFGALQDDEGQSLGADSTALGSATTSRWRTQLFALQCLHEIVQAVVRSGRAENFDATLARSLNINPRQLLISRVPDLIRLAFSAATAQTMEVRLQGLIVLRDVVENFSRSPDPDFEGALLLEQHQAPIAAALTPSFGPDSAPEVLSAAIKICAVFVGSGVVKEISRMGRILKLLASALERCQGTPSSKASTAEGLSANADIMLKVSALSAWAELQVASVQQKYLTEVIQPHRGLLDRLWLGALRDYSLLRTNPDSDTLQMASGGAELTQSRLGREVLLPYYEDASVLLLEAVAIAMDMQTSTIHAAMDGKDVSSDQQAQVGLRSSPAANFFVVYGMSFELATRAVGNPALNGTGVIALHAIKNVVSPRYAGSQVFDSPLFDELCTLCYRIAASESAALRAGMVAVMSAFAQSRQGTADASQINRILAVLAYALRAAVPTRDVASNFLPSDSAEDRVAFLNSAFASYSKVVLCCDPSERLDLALVAIQVYLDLLKDETSRVDLVGPTLPALKAMLDDTQTSASSPGAFSRVVHSVLSACIGNLDDMRGRQGPAVILKAKNNMLAIVLVVTTTRPGVALSRTVLEEACYIVGQRIQDANELQMTAIQCAKALLMSAVRGNAKLRPCVSHILPDMVRYLATTSGAAENLDPQGSLWAGAREIVQTLMSFVSTLDGSQKLGGYSVLLPTLILLLDPELKSNLAHDLATSQLLELAVKDPAAFKDATAALEEDLRLRLEGAVRQAVTSRQSGQKTPASAKPQISLKSFSS